jgi:hypothetical protein
MRACEGEQISEVRLRVSTVLSCDVFLIVG